MPTKKVRDFLQVVAPGRIDTSIEGEVRQLLSECWNSLSGSSETSMADRKVGRAEKFSWQPPILSFEIERHGGAVNGSKFGEIQQWSVNLDELRATHATIGRRRLTDLEPKLDVGALALEVFDLIQQKQSDERLTWMDDACVRINMTRVIPDGPAKQTTAGRRKRFRCAIEPLMIPGGWLRKSSGTHLVFERLCDT